MHPDYQLDEIEEGLYEFFQTKGWTKEVFIDCLEHPKNLNLGTKSVNMVRFFHKYDQDQTIPPMALATLYNDELKKYLKEY